MGKIKNLLVGITVVAVMMASLVSFATQADPVEFLYGDVNNDQQLTANDALIILQYSVNKITLTDMQIVIAKVGKKDTVSASDALLVLQASVQKITPDDFPSGRSGTFVPSESSDPDSSDPVSSTIPLEITPVSEEDYWSYNQLSEVQKNYYNLIVQGVSTRTTDYIRMGNRDVVKQADVRFAYFAVQKDHPELFYMPLSYVFLSQDEDNTAYIAICYNNNDYYLYSAEEVETITPLLKAKIQSIYDEVLVGGMSEYEMALALHDWIANNTTYYTAAAEDPASYPEAWSAANVLVGNQKGVCEGLARAYQLLLYNCGINCTLVSGEGNGGAHMWDLVKLDGQWYETDITWDDQDIENHPFYFFFNQTTDVMSDLHTRAVNVSDIAPADFLTIRSFNYNIPVCTATTDNYFVKTDTFFLNSEEFKAEAPALIAANVEAGKNYLDVMIDGEVFNAAADMSTYVNLDLIEAANELINEPYNDISGYSALVSPGACGFIITWS